MPEIDQAIAEATSASVTRRKRAGNQSRFTTSIRVKELFYRKYFVKREDLKACFT